MLLMSHTVGTPIAITGIPRVFLFKATLLLLTPLPGWIPVSVIWIVLLTLSIELLARIEVVLRRYAKEEEVIRLKNIVICESERSVKKDDEQINLTFKELELLLLLVKNKNKALSREYLLEKIWGFEYIGETRTIDTHIQTLRKKLDLSEQIKTVYKIGYRLED